MIRKTTLSLVATGCLLMSASCLAGGDTKETLVCGDVQYVVYTDTDGGACAREFNSNTLTCSDSAGNAASASCKQGCIEEHGSGGCDQEAVAKDTSTTPAPTPEPTPATPEPTPTTPVEGGTTPVEGTSTVPAVTTDMPKK